MATLMDILGGGLPAGLLSPEQEAVAQSRAQNAGLLNLAFGLLQASQGQPGQRRPGLGQILGQAGPVGVQAYQQSFDKTLKDVVLQQQLAEATRKREQEAAQQQAIQSFVQTLPESERAKFTAFPTQAAEAMFREPKPGPAAIQEYEYAVKQGFNGTFAQFQEQMKKAGATNVTVSAGDKKLTEVLGTKAAERLDSSLSAAQESQNTLQNINELRPVIASGVFAGPLSSAPRAVAQLASSLGVAGANTEELLKNTAVAMQGLAKFELSAAAAMRGQGAITENERMLIQRAAAGRLDQFTAKEVQSLLDAMEKTAKFKIQSHNKQLDVLRNSKNEDVRSLLPLYELQSAPVAPSQSTGVKRFNPATGRVE